MHQKFVRTDDYLSEERLMRERQAIFERSWIFAALSSQLESGSVLPLELIDASILLVRDEYGTARAFRNSCLHRGTKLMCEEERNSGAQPERSSELFPSLSLLKNRVGALKKSAWQASSAARLSCPYHGWGYDLEGKLRHIPKKEGMFFSEKREGGRALRTERHLQQLPLVEREGILWVALSSPKETIEQHLDQLSEQFAPYLLGEFEPIEASDFVFPANWKIVLENALDYYHVPTAHRKTVNAHVEVQPTYAELGLNNLQTVHIAPYGWRGRLDELCTRGGPYRPEQLASLHKYYVFPNLVLNILPYHLTIMQLFPLGPDRCVMRYRFCKRKGAGVIEAARSYATWLASRIILYEDVRLYRSIQEGMAQRSLAHQPLHVEEQAIAHVHMGYQQWIDDYFTEQDQQEKAEEEKEPLKSLRWAK